jgi:hypothetical protein
MEGHKVDPHAVGERDADELEHEPCVAERPKRALCRRFARK